MSFNFAQPSSGNFFKPAEHNGHLILIVRVTEVGERYDSMYGKDKPFAVVDLVDLDDAAPSLEQGVTMSHPGICNKIGNAHRNGEMVLGRITQAPTDKGNPAWVLGPFQPGQDDARASQWLTANPVNQFGQPPAAAPAPAPAPAVPPAAAPGPIASMPQQFAANAQALADAAQQQGATHQLAPPPSAAPAPAAPAPAPANTAELQALLANLQQQNQQ